MKEKTPRHNPDANGGSVQRLVRCFCVSADKTSCIYRDGDVIGYAVDENGETIASHYSSNETFARHDMGLTSGWKHDIYAKRYPEGFRVEWLTHPPEEWDALRDPPNSMFDLKCWSKRRTQFGSTSSCRKADEREQSCQPGYY